MHRPLPLALAACLALGLPGAALAQKPVQVGGPAVIRNPAAAAADAKTRPVVNVRPAAAKAGAPIVVGPGRGAGVQPVTHCPPGLAKKTPACTPPGQAKKGLGQMIDWRQASAIRNPVEAGLPAPDRGTRYAVLNGQVVQVDRSTGRIIDVLGLARALLH